MFRNPAIFVIALMLVIAQPLSVGASLTDDLQAEINQKQTQIQELEKQMAQYNDMLKSSQSQSATLKNAIAQMEAQIKKLEAQIKITQTKISQTNLKIEGLTNDISTQNIELAKQKNNLAQALQMINELDQASSFEIILSENNLSDFLNQMQYAANLQDGLQQKLTAIKDLKTNLETQKTESETQKAALESFKKQLNGQTLVLDSQRDDRQDLLTTSKNQEKVYQSTLTTLQKQRTQIENEIFAAEQKLRALINQNSITGGKGAFIMPVSASVSQTYGCIVDSFARRSYPACNEGNGNGGFHNGIDLSAAMGTPILAVRDGAVSGAGNLGKYAYGKWVTVKHDNGLTTLYGHMSVQSVSVGQKVKAGDVIGYVGSTGYSTGSHLHFTVYATDTFSVQQKWYGPVPIGGPVNPLLYL